ncbi:MAG: hypothetical protein QHJ73_18050, partial [Armatimonadota bacterium]|nr:hypothetical protein [Armatimonadota bacterium]
RVHSSPDQPPVPMRWVSVGLRPGAMLGPKVLRATWYAPGKAPRPVEVDPLPAGLRLILPDLAEWGVVEVEFEQEEGKQK